MPLYRRGGPFQRNSVERRSLRWRRPSSALSCKSPSVSKSKSTHFPATARTSLDLELDLQAQHARLTNLHDELNRLRELKQRLEQAREKGDVDMASWLLEDDKFQILMQQAESGKNGKSQEDKKVEKMLRKTSKEIYKLRKTKAGKGKPDIISFKEKMAFFTRVNLNVPVLPPDESVAEKPIAPVHDHRRHTSEPSRPSSSRSSSTHNHASRKSSGPSPSSIPEVPISSELPTTTTSTSSDRSSKILRDSQTESETQTNDGQRLAEEEDGEPKRYEYVVDRVLGVEV